MASSSELYAAVVAKVDAFFARVEGRYASAMECGAGCDDCCHVQLSLVGVEADAVRAHIAALSGDVRERLHARAEAPIEDRCVALESDGRCAIYEARPLVCRSHGVPVRVRDARRLPMVDACPRNFREGGPGAVDADCVLDQETLSTMLHAVDAEHARATGRAAGVRTPLVEIVRENGG